MCVCLLLWALCDITAFVTVVTCLCIGPVRKTKPKPWEFMNLFFECVWCSCVCVCVWENLHIVYGVKASTAIHRHNDTHYVAFINYQNNNDKNKIKHIEFCNRIQIQYMTSIVVHISMWVPTWINLVCNICLLTFDVTVESQRRLN